MSFSCSSLDHAVSTRKPVVCHAPLPTTDQPNGQLEIQTVPLVDSSGRVHGIAEIFRDLGRKSQMPDIRRLKLQATRDPLTSVANRGELENQLKNLMAQYEQNEDEPYCVIFADADHFKRVNDTYGHLVGDQVLIDLAKHFTDESYSGEIVGRYGGEEFVLLCPATTLEQAFRRADRLRCSLKNAKVGGNDKLTVTCSFGVAQIEPGDTNETLLERADRALYAAKEAGRDRTCSYTSEQLLTKKRGEEKTENTNQGFEFSAKFSALVASEIVVHKLGAFVKDHRAQLVDVQRERVVMHLKGERGIFAIFETPSARQGIEVELQMRGIERADLSKKVWVHVQMRPIARFRHLRGFHERSHQILRELKQYFAAE